MLASYPVIFVCQANVVSTDILVTWFELNFDGPKFQFASYFPIHIQVKHVCT